MIILVTLCSFKEFLPISVAEQIWRPNTPGTGSERGQHLLGRPLAGPDGAFHVAVPVGGGLGAGPVDRANRAADHLAIVEQHAGCETADRSAARPGRARPSAAPRCRRRSRAGRRAGRSAACCRRCCARVLRPAATRRTGRRRARTAARRPPRPSSARPSGSAASVARAASDRPGPCGASGPRAPRARDRR